MALSYMCDSLGGLARITGFPLAVPSDCEINRGSWKLPSSLVTACVRSSFGKNQCRITQCTGTTEHKLRPRGAQPDIIVDNRSFYPRSAWTNGHCMEVPLRMNLRYEHRGSRAKPWEWDLKLEVKRMARQ
jgi:hypothetical protein